jgi:hypothetical protein
MGQDVGLAGLEALPLLSFESFLILGGGNVDLHSDHAV